MKNTKLVLYHGSKTPFKEPVYGEGKPYNDFGLGFYLTENIELANEWASSKDIDGITNKYELDLTGLKILDLTDGNYSILNWLAILIENRIFTKKTIFEINAANYILKNYMINYKDYDVIIGYRADDSYFSFTRYFLLNTITIGQLEEAMEPGNLGKQIVLKSKRAFDQIKYIETTRVQSNIYFPKKEKRDIDAKNRFEEIVSKKDSKTMYINQIMEKDS